MFLTMTNVYQPCITRSTFTNLNSDEYSHDLCYYPSFVKTDKCNGSFNSFNDFSNRKCVPNKT